MELLKSADYGTLALCLENKPYSLPINFIQIGDLIYFHGSARGRKMKILKSNKFASFSVVKAYSLIPSYFSSIDKLACPATQFFKSIVIDGEIEFVEDFKEKSMVLSSLMKKLQPEGGYKPFSDELYKKPVGATTIYKLIPTSQEVKFKFGEKLTKERFDMIVTHLQNRATSLDLETVEMMKSQRSLCGV
jgi:nitroimidazol reductase NimA-like FMN-containing flavoprotein (pyridoxamine 5'-phosphate oxidase superfamily)